jgi:hypothetical protein
VPPSRPVCRPAGRRAELLATACIETAQQIGQFPGNVSRPAQGVDPLPADLHLKEMRADGRFHTEGFDCLPMPLPPTLGPSIAGKRADRQLPLIHGQPLGTWIPRQVNARVEHQCRGILRDHFTWRSFPAGKGFLCGDCLAKTFLHAPSPLAIKNKKTDVFKHPKAFGHVGLLVNKPPGNAGLLFI